MVPTPKTERYQQFRKRFISWFSLLSDQVQKIERLRRLINVEIFCQEIETGIAALDDRHNEKDVPVLTRENFLVASK